MTKAEQLRTGRSDAIRKLGMRYTAAEHHPPVTFAHDPGPDREATQTTWPLEVAPVDDHEQCHDRPDTGEAEDHTRLSAAW